jgi:mevalonate kinase
MIHSTQKIAIGRAHGKLILVGEHSVVYGMPAIALPFPMVEVISTVKKIPESVMISCDYYNGPLSTIPEKMAGITACIYETLKNLKKPAEGIMIQLNSTIPLGRGLGSSAAVAVAIVKSLYSFFGQTIEQKQLMSLVHIAETHAHGNPSGVDMYTAASDVPIWFQKEKKIDAIQIGSPLHLVVADSGRVGDTHAAVTSVRENYQLQKANTEDSLNRLKKITYEARAAISEGNTKLLGSLLNLAQDELILLGVSDEGLNQLVNAARALGAMGSKLTGGGRGGCVLALAENPVHAKQLADHLMKSGASKTWNFTLGQTIG